MQWKVSLYDSFEKEFDELAEAVRLELIAGMNVLEERMLAGRM